MAENLGEISPEITEELHTLFRKISPKIGIILPEIGTGGSGTPPMMAVAGHVAMAAVAAAEESRTSQW